jgi:hypothetical protein
MAAQLSRRGFLVAAGTAAASVAIDSRLTPAAATTTPAPAPSMTTTHGAPTLLGAHAAVLGAPMARPVVRSETMQVGAVVSEPATVKIVAWPVGNPGHTVESQWVPTAIGMDPANPVNVAKIRMPTGVGTPPDAWQWRTYVAVRATPPQAGLSAAYGSDGVVRTIPARPVAGAAAALSIATGSCTQIAHPSQPDRPIGSAIAIVDSRPAFFVHMGDTSYVDTWKEFLEDTPAHIYTKFATGLRRHCCQPDLARLYNQTMVRMVLDDHDLGPDDC